jgi:hypothetical protein
MDIIQPSMRISEMKKNNDKEFIQLDNFTAKMKFSNYTYYSGDFKINKKYIIEL